VSEGVKLGLSLCYQGINVFFLVCCILSLIFNVDQFALMQIAALNFINIALFKIQLYFSFLSFFLHAILDNLRPVEKLQSFNKSK
jgi:hypothetical protein